MSKSTISLIIYCVGMSGVLYVALPNIELFNTNFWILCVSISVILNAKTWSGEYIKEEKKDCQKK